MNSFTPQDGVLLRQYLATQSGIHLLSDLRDHADSIEGEGDTIEKAGLAAKESKGAKGVLKLILQKATENIEQREESPFVQIDQGT